MFRKYLQKRHREEHVLLLFLVKFLSKFSPDWPVSIINVLFRSLESLPALKVSLEEEVSHLKTNTFNKCFIILVSFENWRSDKSRDRIMQISESFKSFPRFVVVIHDSESSTNYGLAKLLSFPTFEINPRKEVWYKN